MFREMSTPYTEEEWTELKKQFRACPTYNPQDDTIQTSDFPVFCLEHMRINKPPQELQAVMDYWDNNQGGKMDWDFFYKHISKLTSNVGESFSFYVKNCDKDGNGFTSVDEFGEIHKLLKNFDKEFNGLTFEKFLEEFDTNKDGKVSVQECIDYILKVTEGKKAL